MSTPSIKVGQGNWGIKAGNLLGYANTEKKFSPVEFTSTRSLNTATRVNASGNIEIVNANIPRIDYFGGQASLLVEPSGSNLALQSENFVTTWAANNLNITSGFTSPFNNANGTLIEATSVAGRLRQTIAAITSGTTHTFSLFAKADSFALTSGITLTVNDGTSSNYASGVCQAFRLDTGALGTSGTVGAGFTLTRASIENYGNGWYRCNMTVTASYTPATSIIGVRATSTISAGLPSTPSGSTVYIWGAQVETGSVATSYIPTTTGSVTRNADVISVTGVAGLIGQTEGTLYAEIDLRNSAVTAIFVIDDGDTSDFISIIRLANFTIRVQIRRAGASIASIITSSPVSLGVHKIALAYKNADYALYIDGVNAGTSANSTDYPATALTQCVLSNTSYGQLNDRIRAYALYQTRLPNTTTDGSPSLQSITTL